MRHDSGSPHLPLSRSPPGRVPIPLTRPAAPGRVTIPAAVKRRFFNLLAAVSLVLCAATVVLWVQS